MLSPSAFGYAIVTDPIRTGKESYYECGSFELRDRDIRQIQSTHDERYDDSETVLLSPAVYLYFTKLASSRGIEGGIFVTGLKKEFGLTVEEPLPSSFQQLLLAKKDQRSAISNILRFEGAAGLTISHDRGVHSTKMAKE
ncbi:hypothetical protein C8J55DRAFT_492711 [Lentinula edodes]|uniref:Uncharacterized protein n=1 Tax=Lentinula lateritia TaxID=40482 RepID=A0A9W8ZW98_9AGAR|nr:hypothetical protein C8J55DRAFT_492711 [Lentinula edodes]